MKLETDDLITMMKYAAENSKLLNDSLVRIQNLQNTINEQEKSLRRLVQEKETSNGNQS